MPEFGNKFEQDHSDFAQLESIVQAAGGYVQPTVDLRPKTLEAARTACRQRRTNIRLGSLAVFVLFLAATGVPEFFFSSNLGPAFVQSSDLHHRATRSAVKGNVGTNWALYEVFSEFRREQAELLHHAD